MTASSLLGNSLSSCAADLLTEGRLAGSPLADETALVQVVYAHSEAPLLWTAGGEPTVQARALLQALAHAANVGLRPEDYGTAGLEAAAAQLTAESFANDLTLYDRLLTRAAVRLVSHLHYGRIDPRAADVEFPEPRTDLDVAAAVAAMATAADLPAAVAALEPRFNHSH